MTLIHSGPNSSISEPFIAANNDKNWLGEAKLGICGQSPKAKTLGFTMLRKRPKEWVRPVSRPLLLICKSHSIMDRNF